MPKLVLGLSTRAKQGETLLPGLKASPFINLML